MNQTVTTQKSKKQQQQQPIRAKKYIKIKQYSLKTKWI